MVTKEGKAETSFPINTNEANMANTTNLENDLETSEQTIYTW